MSDVLTVKDVADMLGCEEDTVRDKTRQRELPGLKFGRDWVYPRQALLDALNQMAAQAKAKSEPANVKTLVPVQGQRGRPRKVPPVLPVLPQS